MYCRIYNKIIYSIIYIFFILLFTICFCYYRLLIEKIKFFKRGYVLDGYPTTVAQAKMLFQFDDTSSVQQNIDVNKLPSTYINNLIVFFY